MRRAITGRFNSPGHVLRFGVGGLVLAALLFLTAAWIYPAENGYVFMEKSASYLGSFDKSRNPVGWWLFSLGLLVLGAVSTGAALFRHRQLARAVETGWALYVATGAFVLGGVIFGLLALIPDARTAHVGPWSFNDIHDRLAAFVFFLLGLGMTFDGFLMLGDRIANGHTRIDHRVLRRPYLTFIAIGLVAGISLLTWHIQCRLDSSLKEWPGEGIYSFPMWEWILTFLGPGTLVWVAWSFAVAPTKRQSED